MDIVVDNQTALTADFWRQSEYRHVFSTCLMMMSREDATTDRRTSAIFLSPVYKAGRHNVVVQQHPTVDSRLEEWPIIHLDYLTYLYKPASKGQLRPNLQREVI